MGWWSKGRDNSDGTYSKVSGSNEKLTNGFGKTCEIPKMVLEGLNSQNEGTVIMRIRSLGGENNYPKTDICEQLILLVQREGRENVVNLASKTLISVLKHVLHAETVILLIRRGLFAKNEKTAEFFVNLLEEPGCRISLKKCAVEMLTGFTEEDISSETMDRMEAGLFERYEDSTENDEIRGLIRHRFGPNRNGRPKVIVEEERGDETVAIEQEGAHEKETEALDVFSGWIEMLKHPDEKKREIAAKSLVSIIGQTSDRKKIERVIDTLRKGGSEFFSQFRKAKDILHNLGPESNKLHKMSTLPPGPNGPKRDSRTPTGKIRTPRKR